MTGWEFCSILTNGYPGSEYAGESPPFPKAVLFHCWIAFAIFLDVWLNLASLWSVSIISFVFWNNWLILACFLHNSPSDTWTQISCLFSSSLNLVIYQNTQVQYVLNVSLPTNKLTLEFLTKISTKMCYLRISWPTFFKKFSSKTPKVGVGMDGLCMSVYGDI